MKLGIKKGNQKKIIGNMPQHYPADRVYLDGDTTKTVQYAISDYKVLWTGDSHTVGDTINLNDSISNYKKIMFVFNVIPSRTPDFDVPADQMWYLEIQTFSRWDVSAFGANIKAFTVKRNSDTELELLAYAKVDSSSQYNTGLVKIIGFKTN